MDEAVLAIWHAQQVRPWTTDLITIVEKSMTEAGLRTPIRRPPAMCFLDISGYTRLTQTEVTRRQPSWRRRSGGLCIASQPSAVAAP